MDGIRNDDLLTKVNELLRLVERLEVVWEEEKPASSSTRPSHISQKLPSISKTKLPPLPRRINRRRAKDHQSKHHSDTISDSSFSSSASYAAKDTYSTLPQLNHTLSSSSRSTYTSNKFYNSNSNNGNLGGGDPTPSLPSTRRRHSTASSRSEDGWIHDEDNVSNNDYTDLAAENDTELEANSPSSGRNADNEEKKVEDAMVLGKQDTVGHTKHTLDNDKSSAEPDQVDEHHFVAQQDWINALKMSFSVDKALAQLGSLDTRTESLPNRKKLDQITQRLEKLKYSVGTAVEFCSNRLEKIEIEQKLKNSPAYLQMPTVEIKLDAPVPSTVTTTTNATANVSPSTALPLALPNDDAIEQNTREQHTLLTKTKKDPSKEPNNYSFSDTTRTDINKSSSAAFSSPTSSSSLMNYHGDTQEKLINQLSQVSHQLKQSSLNFAQNLQSGSVILEENENQLDKNLEKTKLQSTRLKTYSNSATWTTCWTITVVFGVFIAWMFMFFIIRFT